ncbi:hypothetical protein, partial [Geobacillus sp. CCR]
GILLLGIGRVLLSLRFLVQSENTLPFFFWSSKKLYTKFYTSSINGMNKNGFCIPCQSSSKKRRRLYTVSQLEKNRFCDGFCQIPYLQAADKMQRIAVMGSFNNIFYNKKLCAK